MKRETGNLQDTLRITSHGSMLKALTGQIASSVAALAIKSGISIIVLPIAMRSLTIEGANVFFLLSSILGISIGVTQGFTSTFQRFIGYSLSGVRLTDFNNIGSLNLNSDTIDEYEISTIKSTYIATNLYGALLLLLFGSFTALLVLKDPISYLGAESGKYWRATFFLVCLACLNHFLSFASGILRAHNEIILTSKVSIMWSVISLVMFAGFYILSRIDIFILIAVLQVPILGSHLTCLWIVRSRKFIARKMRYRIEKSVFLLVFSKAWKSVVSSTTGSWINNGLPLVIGNLFVPSISAPFLLLLRIYGIMENFANAVIQAKVPLLISNWSQSRGKFVKELNRVWLISSGVIVLSHLGFMLFGEWLMNILDITEYVIEAKLIVHFSFIIYFRRYIGFSQLLCNLKNHIVDLYIIPVYGIVLFGSILLYLNDTLIDLIVGHYISLLLTIIIQHVHNLRILGKDVTKLVLIKTIYICLLLVVLNIYFIV